MTAARKVGGSAGNRGKGRVKGVPNKVTKALKDMILGALDDAGGQEYLAQQAKTNPAAFLTLVGKVLPMDVNAIVSAKIEPITFCRVDASGPPVDNADD